MSKTDTDIFDDPKPKPKRKLGLLTRKPENLAAPKKSENELHRIRRAKAAELREEQAAVVCILMGAGIKDRTIARILKMGVKTLRKNFKSELADGGEEAVAQVATKLFSLALSGNMAAITLWLKSRAGWTETQEIDVAINTGRDLTMVERSQRMMALFTSNPQFREMMEGQKALAQKAIDVSSTSKEEEEGEGNEEN